MCQGTSHKEWYCRRELLSSIVNHPTAVIPLPVSTFIEAGRKDEILTRVDGYPPLTPPPGLVIQVIRDIEGNEMYEHMTEVAYFALDDRVGSWFELGERRWMRMRRYMRLAETEFKKCLKHDIGHHIMVWRRHNLSTSPERLPVSGNVASKASNRRKRRTGNFGKGVSAGKAM
ncbi:hypothetical protein DL98DRAFT_579372 [Cadophora sp. DSE1049]|nr:hypothetical protein DL98DRAFT_579372 [Cadophora sp. DSE1049]